MIESKKVKSEEEAIELISEKFKTDPVFAYLFTKKGGSTSSSEATLRAENEIMKKIMGFVKIETAKTENTIKEIFKVVEVIAAQPDVPTRQLKKDGFSITNPDLSQEGINKLRKQFNS